MNKHFFIKKNFLIQRAGFTLTEILLAVMIVGLIGVALASISRAAARESGVGRSKIMLRNNLSSFERQLRKDLNAATIVKSVKGPLQDGDVSGSNPYVALIEFITNGKRNETNVVSSLPGKKVVYCFKLGANTNNIVPATARRGGEIFRLEGNLSNAYPTCSGSTYNTNKVILNNVKFIPSNYNGGEYPVPLFENYTRDYEGNTYLGYVKINIITELDSTPVVNEVLEEIIALPTEVIMEED